MLPVVDKPAIQYVVEEAVAAGLTDILIITGRGKRAIEDHFDRNFELEHYLEQPGKHDLLEEVQDVAELADIHYVRQRDPLGLGHAVSVAREHVGDEPFAVLLGDDIMVDDGELLRSMLDVHERDGRVGARAARGRARGDLVVRLRRARGRSTTACVRVRVDRREAAARGRAVEPRGHRPLRVHARRSSTRSTASSPGVGGELQLTDAIALLLETRAGLRPRVRATAATTSARSSTSSGPTSSSRSTAPTSGPSSRDFLRDARARRGCRDLDARDPARPTSQARDPRRGRAARRRSTVALARRARSRARRATSSRREPVPPFANTAMDGYAVRAADTAGAPTDAPVRLRVVGELPAGHAPTVAVGAGRGDPHHDRRADARRRRRDRDGRAHRRVDGDDGRASITLAVEPGDHVRRAGGDLEAGRRRCSSRAPCSRPRTSACSRASASPRSRSYPRPRVGVLSTGDELVETRAARAGQDPRLQPADAARASSPRPAAEPVDLGIGARRRSAR